MTVPAASYSDLLKRISRSTPPIFIFGGFAEDALLSGKTTRPHEDVDIFLVRKDLDDHVRRFQGFGFRRYEIYLEDPSGNPTVLHGEHDGLVVELCVFDVEESGRIYFDIYGHDQETRYRVYVAGDVLSHPRTGLNGVEIQTVSPLAQYQLRAGVHITGAFGDMREKDLKAQRALKQKFFKTTSEAELRPEVVKLY